MCIFSREVDSVAQTKIFARRQKGDRQALVYQMSYQAAQDVAMILPIPVAGGADSDSVRFTDFSGLADFFDRLDALFPKPKSIGSQIWAARSLAPTLEVHSVGNFLASFAPALRDMDRLDECFRLPPAVWEQLPGYALYGFVVAQLKPGAVKVHPLAFSFPMEAPDKLYFPTRHVHDGEVHQRATFDHVLYAQAGADPFRRLGAGYGDDEDVPPPPPGTFTVTSFDFVHPDQKLFRRAVTETLPNTDIWAHLPADKAPVDSESTI